MLPYIPDHRIGQKDGNGVLPTSTPYSQVIVSKHPVYRHRLSVEQPVELEKHTQK